MPENEREQSHQELWKSQEGVPMQPSADEVRAKARRYEKESVLVYWVALGLTPLFVIPVLYNLMRLREPLFITAYSFTLATFCCIAWGFLRKGPGRMASAEPCAIYLRRKFEEKRQGLLWVRGCLLLLVPAMVASWLGRGPGRRARSMNVESEWLLGLLDGPAPFVLIALVLAFLWFVFTKEARRFAQSIEKLRQE